ncbi:MAG TPA: DUF4350 domain-containing protein [Polyangiales bacterium]|jgi:hypothetical protein|nr:DUF4350 domain-containing protein [Polyangiales bacterium]
MSGERKTSSVLGASLLAASLVLVLLGERVLGAGALRSAATGAGALLFLVASALRIGALRAATGDVRAVEARLLASYGGVLLALVLYAGSTDACLDALKLEGDSRTRAYGVLTVLWLATMLVSGAALFFMQLVYARMPVAASVELRRVRTGAYAGLTLALSTVFVLAINYVAGVRDVRRDVSYFKTTKPSVGTERMLQKLDAPVKAILFWRKTDDVLQQVEPYFATLHAHTNKLRYEVLDSALVPELARKQRVSGNGFVLLLRGEGDKQKAQSFRIGVELTEARPQLKKLDSLFQQSFAKLARPERTIALTVGHGERGERPEDTQGEGTQLLEDIWKRLNLKTDKLGLTSGLANAVPEGTSAVVVTGPRDKFLPEEAAALLAYVRKGGRLLLMLDPDTDDGLAPLLKGLGLERMPGTLVSETDHMQHAHDPSDKALVFSNGYSSHPSVTTVARYQNDVATIFVRGAGLRKAVAGDLTPKPSISFPLHSSPLFFRDLNGNLARDRDEPEEQVNMVAAVTLGDKSSTEGRALVIGDGDFMTDKVGQNNGNMMLFVDALAWLVGNEELSAEVSSEEDRPIEHTREQDKLWFYATTFAMPMPVLGLGLWVSRRRRKRAEAAS